jgi:serine/threonine protein kinase
VEPDRWKQVEDLYNAALTVESAKREEFLEQASPDASIREEVLSLLRVTSDGETFLRQAAAALLPPEMPDLTGQRFGDYDLTSFIGRGSMGYVYRARQIAPARDVAIKILPDHLSWNADAVARFEREARLLASLRHPNIAALLGVVTAGDRQGLVLELVDGRSLHDVIGAAPVPFERAMAIADQIAEALACAHAQNIIHRDLKPANIKLTPAGIVKVLDFGLAKVWRGGEPGVDLSKISTTQSFATRDGVVLGTPAYMSPEQARGQTVDKRTDLWAFGCILFEMLAGHRPFAGRDPVETVQLILEHDPEWDAVPTTTPGGVVQLIRRCLKKDPAKRPGDIARLRNSLLQRARGSGSDGLLTRLSRTAARWKPRW